MAIEEKLQKLQQMREQAQQGGGPQRIKAQHERGKLSARERIDLLMDKGTFQEIDAFVLHRTTEFGMGDQKFLGDAVVTVLGQPQEVDEVVLAMQVVRVQGVEGQA